MSEQVNDSDREGKVLELPRPVRVADPDGTESERVPKMWRGMIRGPDGFEPRFIGLLEIAATPEQLSEKQQDMLRRLINQFGEAVRTVLATPPEKIECTCSGITDTRGNKIPSSTCVQHKEIALWL